jgi:hypothetical protein
LPLSLTEFGVGTGGDVTPANAATILGDMMRLIFGNANSTGFLMWGFHQESGAGATTLFKPSAALYTVNTSNFNNWTITDAGKKWQDLLGVQDWDLNPNNGWTTQLDATVGDDGQITFNGFWGDYELTINGQAYPITITKGNEQYSRVIAPGDYDADGVVDAGDYVIWRKTVGSSTDLRADGDGNRIIDEADYVIWRSRFGTSYGSGSFQAVPEPTGALLVLACCFAFSNRVVVRRRSC